jgi:predicted O-linked N-acetylglucosamine transferase (SPINDLY family)
MADRPHIAQAFAEAVGHHRAGRVAQAEPIYRQILAQDPEHSHALHLLGVACYQTGRTSEALSHLQHAIRIDGSCAPFHESLGNACLACGQLDAAAASFRRALELAPQSAGALNGLGVALKTQGQLDEAIDVYRRALGLFPGFAEVHNNLANALAQAGRADEAVECYRQALRAKPDYADAHANLGNALRELARLDEAVAAYARAIELVPAHAQALNNLGVVYKTQGQNDKAVDCYQRAIRAQPGFAHAHTNLGNALQELGRLDEAIECYRTSLQLAPTDAETHNSLGVALQLRGQLAESIAEHRRAVELDPGNAARHSSLIYTLNRDPAMTPEALFAEHRAWAERHAEPLTRTAAPHANDRSPGRRLRIGYVSDHFRKHAVNYFVEPILAAHDHTQFEIYGYATSFLADDVTRRLQAHADTWRDVAGWSDERLAKLVRDDRIDILVDLAGHIGGNRLLMFARKPAPVQVTYLGYQNTTGMSAMDYRLTDAHADPPGTTEQWHTEELVRLPRTFFVYQPSPTAPPVSPLPAAANKFVTFGSFNNFSKVTPEVLAAWAEILRRVPDARLLVLAHVTPGLERYVRDAFERERIAGERIALARCCPHDAYLKLIAGVDIALDPFPFNGHTTTCDCLWQGVPVVSWAGTTYVSRFGSSALMNLGLEELVSGSRDAYVEIAAALAEDRSQLVHLRKELRGRMLRSPILDAQAFTRELEAAYRETWTRWCAKSGT